MQRSRLAERFVWFKWGFVAETNGPALWPCEDLWHAGKKAENADTDRYWWAGLLQLAMSQMPIYSLYRGLLFWTRALLVLVQSSELHSEWSTTRALWWLARTQLQWCPYSQIWTSSSGCNGVISSSSARWQRTTRNMVASYGYVVITNGYVIMVI